MHQVDWQDFETKCADEKTTLFTCSAILIILADASGRREELQQMYDICQQHGVKVALSDVIHCRTHHARLSSFVPFGFITNDCIVMNSPSKNFNTAEFLNCQYLHHKESFMASPHRSCD